MSTRATYRFESGDTSRRNSGDGMQHPPVTFYIHHDGYPQGAAFYFWNMHHEASHDRTAAGRFYRSNERAEFTDGHDAHGDTEFRYTLRGSMLTAYKRYSGADVCTWSAFFVGEWHEFVNQYGRGSWDDFTPLRSIAPVYDYAGNRARIYSRAQILAALDKARVGLQAYTLAHPTMSGNIGWHKDQVSEYERALDSYDAKDPAPATANG
jgi:hypothetical protein